MARNIGPITVGPVTVSMAPNNTDRIGLKSSSTQDNQADSAQVTAPPTVTKRRIEIPPLDRSRSFRLSPPSKRMIATETETKGKSTSPNARSG